MVQPAKRFDLWRRLYTRFLIEPFPVTDGEGPAVSTLVQPVTDADELLKNYGLVTFNSASFDADQVVNGPTVPSGKRWLIYVLRWGRSSGNRTALQWIINDASEGAFMIIRGFAAAADDTHLMETPLPLEEGDQVRLNFIGGSTATVAKFDLWLSEEDAY